MIKELKLIDNFLDETYSKELFNYLKNNINWCNELLSVTNEKVKIKRHMAYLYDEEKYYHYANLYFKGSVWDEKTKELLYKVNNYCEHEFNSVLLNMYKDGKDTIQWHSDKEKELGDFAVIASINLGASRKFWYLNKETGEKDFVTCKNGDLLIMNAGFQENFLHAILPEKEIKDSRISLTFRKVNYDITNIS